MSLAHAHQHAVQFSLPCGYAIGHFYKQTDMFEEICRQHTHVMPGHGPLASPVSSRIQ